MTTTETTIRDSQRHLEQVAELREGMDIEATEDALADVAIVPRNVILGWTPEERAAVQAFGIHGGDRPAILGTSHISGPAIVEEAPGHTYQYCKTCGARLTYFETAHGAEFAVFNEGALVGTDCAGAAADGNHYPEKKKGKKR